MLSRITGGPRQTGYREQAQAGTEMTKPVAEQTMRQVAAILRKCLEEGLPVEIEGLGVFCRRADGEVDFLAEIRPKVFIAYSDENFAEAERLRQCLEAAGFDPWLDKKRLLPGQNWPRSIERAIEVSDFFIACFSKRGMGKRGFFHSELRYALDCARRLPLGEIFFIPVRFDDCPVPSPVSKEIQYVDLFPDWSQGLDRIVSVMRRNASQARPRAA